MSTQALQVMPVTSTIHRVNIFFFTYTSWQQGNKNMKGITIIKWLLKKMDLSHVKKCDLHWPCIYKLQILICNHSNILKYYFTISNTESVIILTIYSIIKIQCLWKNTRGPRRHLASFLINQCDLKKAERGWPDEYFCKIILKFVSSQTRFITWIKILKIISIKIEQFDPFKVWQSFVSVKAMAIIKFVKGSAVVFQRRQFLTYRYSEKTLDTLGLYSSTRTHIITDISLEFSLKTVCKLVETWLYRELTFSTSSVLPTITVKNTKKKNNETTSGTF